MLNKKGQISTGMTWVIATIIIIVIVVISIIASSSLSKNLKSGFSLVDKERDFVASNSIVGFFEGGGVSALAIASVNSDDYSMLKTQFDRFLDILSVGRPGVSDWNLDLYVDDEGELDLGSETIGSFDYFHTPIEINDGSKEIKFDFWEDCQGNTCR